MASVYAKSDLLICRAGASTVSEIMSVGVAAIFIPYPYAVDNHQYYNALPLVNDGAAYMLIQRELNVDKLSEIVRDIDRDKCKTMAVKAKKMALNNSCEEIANIILSYTVNKLV